MYLETGNKYYYIIVPLGTYCVRGGWTARRYSMPDFLFVVRKYNSNYRTKLEQRDINIALLTQHTVIVWIFDLLQDAVHERFWRARF